MAEAGFAISCRKQKRPAAFAASRSSPAYQEQLPVSATAMPTTSAVEAATTVEASTTMKPSADATTEAATVTASAVTASAVVAASAIVAATVAPTTAAITPATVAPTTSPAAPTPRASPAIPRAGANEYAASEPVSVISVRRACVRVVSVVAVVAGRRTITHPHADCDLCLRVRQRQHQKNTNQSQIFQVTHGESPLSQIRPLATKPIGSAGSPDLSLSLF